MYIASTAMPLGKYKGRMLIELPEAIADL
ncbi:putative quorum-sensing-regulated virulence factor [Xenorhabdus sp. PR6a]